MQKMKLSEHHSCTHHLLSIADLLYLKGQVLHSTEIFEHEPFKEKKLYYQLYSSVISQ
jgi:hypothetical protein